MARTEQELTANTDADFKAVIEELRVFMVRAATFLRGRPTHSTGTAARGEARIIVPPDFPPTEFLRFGATYPVVVRHPTPRPAIGVNPANPTDPDKFDDRTLDGAAMSVKFLDPADPKGDGFHDVLMNAGRVLFVPSARAFNRLIRTPNDQRQALMASGDLDDGLLTEGFRSGSVTEFYYHTQIAFELTDLTGATRYVKFRAVPADRGPERGLLPPGLRANGFTFQAMFPDDQRAADYRRRDFEFRVRHQAVEYLLQAQLHPAGDRRALSPMRYWDERFCPWVDVAHVRLTEVLAQDEMDRLNFHVNRTHDSINIPLAVTADDPASIAHARALVYSHSWQARQAAPQPHIV